MANLSLSQLREAQKAEAAGWVLNPAWETAPGRFPGLEPDAYKPLNLGPPPAKSTDGSPAEGSLPLQASPPAPSVDLADLGESDGPGPSFERLVTAPGPKLDRAWAAGHCRIFPERFSTAADIPEDWKAENWSGAPSPWCSVEGQPNHPDFDANLTAIEAQDVKSEKGG